MSTSKSINSALISVYNKEGLEPIVKKLNELGVTIYSTGETCVDLAIEALRTFYSPN